MATNFLQEELEAHLAAKRAFETPEAPPERNDLDLLLDYVTDEARRCVLHSQYGPDMDTFWIHQRHAARANSSNLN